MKKIGMSLLAVLGLSLCSSAFAADVTTLPGCAKRGGVYCQLPNISANCSLDTCQNSLASTGYCTVDAVYTSDGSQIISCSVCAADEATTLPIALNCDICSSLGGACLGM